MQHIRLKYLINMNNKIKNGLAGIVLSANLMTAAQSFGEPVISHAPLPAAYAIMIANREGTAEIHENEFAKNHPYETVGVILGVPAAILAGAYMSLRKIANYQLKKSK